MAENIAEHRDAVKIKKMQFTSILKKFGIYCKNSDVQSIRWSCIYIFLPASLPAYMTTCLPACLHGNLPNIFLPSYKTFLPFYVYSCLLACLPAWHPACLPVNFPLHTCPHTYLYTCLHIDIFTCLPANLPTILGNSSKPTGHLTNYSIMKLLY